MSRDGASMLDMLIAAQDAREFASSLDELAFAASKLHQAAVVRQLEIMGQAASRVSMGFRTRHPEVPWSKLIGLRIRLLCVYDVLPAESIWRILTVSLPEIIVNLETLVRQYAEEAAED